MFYAQRPQTRWERYREYLRRALAVKDYIDRARDAAEIIDRNMREPNYDDVRDITDMSHYRDGVFEALTGDGLPWLIDHFNRQQRTIDYFTCRLDGGCNPEDIDRPNETYRFRPFRWVATPGNTLRQRLSLSSRLWR
jgi:hypothetical protein